MGETDKVNTDLLLKDLGGCGLFQILLSIATCLSLVPKYFFHYFMTFGIYNPGWRCLDNVTYTNNIISGTDFTNDIINQVEDNRTSSEYLTDTCQGYETCQRIEFNPVASTIVTEWELVCGKSWVISVIISCEMAATGVGFLVAGYVGDQFGRKDSLHICIFIQLVLHFIAMWSVSWEMYVAIGILLGIVSTSDAQAVVLQNEFVIPKWRIRVTSIPTWGLAITMFSIIAMIVQDWKILRVCTCFTALVALIVLFWVPKSLRWLSVKNKKEETMSVVSKIAKFNKTEIPDGSVINSLFQMDEEKHRSYTIFDLFRKGYRRSTFVIGFAFMSSDLIYFALSFGISSLPGNVYENMIILAVAEIPANIISVSVANVFGRRKSNALLNLLVSLFLFGVVAMDFLATGQTKVIGTLVLVVTGKLFLNASWYIMATVTVEIYPTVIRGTINAYSRMMSIFGGVISPLLIPSDSSTFYLCYLAMAALGLLISFSVLLLPETKGNTLQDLWNESSREENNTKNNNNQIV